MEKKIETRACATCGRELPITMFAQNHYGIAKSCKECNGKKIADGKAYKNNVASLQAELEKAKCARLADYSPRDFMTELARRGYKGKLTYTKVEVINIENF